MTPESLTHHDQSGDTSTESAENTEALAGSIFEQISQLHERYLQGETFEDDSDQSTVSRSYHHYASQDAVIVINREHNATTKLPDTPVVLTVLLGETGKGPLPKVSDPLVIYYVRDQESNKPNPQFSMGIHATSDEGRAQLDLVPPLGEARQGHMGTVQRYTTGKNPPDPLNAMAGILDAMQKMAYNSSRRESMGLITTQEHPLVIYNANPSTTGH